MERYGGLTPGTDYDQLVVNNTATLAGTLDLSYISPFTASLGEEFVIMDANMLNGTFDAVNFPDGQNWFIYYDTGAGTVTVGICQDGDGDGVCDADDICEGFDDNLDADSDGVPDGCDNCPGFDDAQDADSDGVPDGCDNCPNTAGGVVVDEFGCLLPGDIDGNGCVNLPDVLLFAEAWGTCQGDPDYNPDADLNGDNCVNLPDLLTLASHWGECL